MDLPGESAERGFDPKAYFTTLDRNGDGKIDGDEITERMAYRAEEIDTNGDGVISKEEFLANIARSRAAREQGAGRGEAER